MQYKTIFLHMSRLKVFVSSTCYDLSLIRNELYSFISRLGHEPVLSEYNDILYDPNFHTTDSCLKELKNCDLVICIVGKRFGCEYPISATENIMWPEVKELIDTGKSPANLSISHMETLHAITLKKPIYAFVDKHVLNDHKVYERNKNNKEIIGKINFPSIEDPSTACHIFDFIDFLLHRTINNSLIPFEKPEDIENFIKAQWSSLFQRLLSEKREQRMQQSTVDDISNQLSDLKSLIVSSITQEDLKETAKGVLKYKNLILILTFLITKSSQSSTIDLVTYTKSLSDLLHEIDIKSITYSERNSNIFRPRLVFIKADDSFFESRIQIPKIKEQWENFKELEEGKKRAIVDATLESNSLPILPLIRYHREKFMEYKDKLLIHSEGDTDEN